MRGGRQQAKPDVGRPLDGRVRRHRGTLAFPAASDEQRATNDDGSDAGPHRNVDCLLLFDRELDRPKLCFVRFLCEAEAGEDQAEHTCDDEQNSNYLDRVHWCLRWLLGPLKGRVAVPIVNA